MVKLLTLTEGMEVDCLEGECGRMSRALVNSDTKALAHVAVESTGAEAGHLVPFAYIRSVSDQIRLDCTMTEFDAFETADVAAMEQDFFAAAQGIQKVRTVVRHNIPVGEDEIYENEDVRADNGIVGRLHGLVVDATSGKLEQLLVTTGHLFGKREIAVPASLVSGFDAHEVKLSGSKSEIRQPSAA